MSDAGHLPHQRELPLIHRGFTVHPAFTPVSPVLHPPSVASRPS
ncbi:hypothetical protein BN2537_15387 [Streptomyces venezuelae]|nr:hypothetical protein BN2537_15387 [Streptomyces venezuelae]